MIDLDALHARLTDLPGLGAVSKTEIAGRMVFGFNGLIAAIDPRSTIDDAELAIRKTFANRAAVQPTQTPIQIQTPMPAPAAAAAPTIQPQGKPMSTPASGGFAASLKAMLDEAKAGLAQAQNDGRARVGAAVSKLNEAQTATAKVADGMASQIEDAAAAALSDLGQISNEI